MNTTYKLLFGVVLVVIVAVGGYYAWGGSSGDDLANLAPDAKLTDDQVTQLVGRISKFLVVPDGEKPSVAVIKDVQQLAAQQSFYNGAKDGDILVVYSTRAIIYDAKANKLVNVGPIIRNDVPPTDGTTASASASVSPEGSPAVTPKLVPITIDVRNGTTSAGLAGATASDLKKNKLYTIGKVGDAQGTYHETVVVDLTKGTDKTATIAALAKQLGAKVVTKLPAGELTTTVDALVIVGK